MNIRKTKVFNSVHFSQSPWQYSRGPFYTPAKQTKIDELMPTDGFTREQTLCRLCLLFPRVAKHEIHRLFRMYNEDPLCTIDTLLYSEMTRIAKMKASHRRNSKVPPPKNPHGTCARTSSIHKRKSFDWRTITSGTVYNVQPDAIPVPQVRHVLDNYGGQLPATRFRNLVANATFDNNGIKNIVFETYKASDKSDVENKPPQNHETNTSILDSPGRMQTVLHSQLLVDSNGTNHRHSLKMKLSRNGDSYSAKMISA